MSLTKIAEGVLAQAKKVDEYIASKNLPEASFDQDVMQGLPVEIELARLQVVQDTYKLRRLAQGPPGHGLEMAQSYTDVLSLHFVYHYKIAEVVPLEGSTTYDAIAEAIKVPPIITSRFIRHAMLNYVFQETEDGKVAHTAFSRELVKDKGFSDSIGFTIEEVTPALFRAIDAQQKWQYSPEQNQTGYQLAFDTDLSIYQYLSTRPSRGMRVGSAMQYWTRGDVWDLRHLLRAYDWSSIDSEKNVFVDLGGGQGGISKVVAGATSHLKLVVQDIPSTVADGEKLLPAEFQGRISFKAGNILEGPVVKGAQVYFLRYILHNWSDKYALQILRGIVPALEPGNKVLIYELMPTEEREKGFGDKLALNLDLVMNGLFNGSERRKSEWHQLFAQVDKRLVIKGFHQPPGSALSLLEAVWEP